jgi:hypothetical protein
MQIESHDIVVLKRDGHKLRCVMYHNLEGTIVTPHFIVNVKKSENEVPSWRKIRKIHNLSNSVNLSMAEPQEDLSVIEVNPCSKCVHRLQKAVSDYCPGFFKKIKGEEDTKSDD